MNNTDSQKIFFLNDGTTINPLIVAMLKKRGISSQEEISKYLEPQLKDLPPPSDMADLQKASILVGDAIINNHPILIWGDYDVDGTTATALLLRFLKAVRHKNTDFHIPNRLVEGYGLQSESLCKIASDKDLDNKILITVDNGISAHKAVEQAKRLGYKVIITDHHTPPEKSVAADAILNPRQVHCNFSGKNLAGVGVAFYLIIGVRGYLQKKNYFNKTIKTPNLKQFLDLVAIGTVADMVALDETNRILVRAGLETIADKTNPGIYSLCTKMNLDCSFLRSEDISFQIAPKINAAGRLGFAERAVSLLMCNYMSEADSLCDQLIKANEERKNITLNNFSKAINNIKNSFANQKNCIVVSGDFHIGVAGIVASNLVEKYEKPAIVLCKQENGVQKGSARSVEGINLYEALSVCHTLLEGFGGHAMAAGMSLRTENVKQFAVMFDSAVSAQYSNQIEPGVSITEEAISVEKLFKEKVLKQLLLLEPHGVGNPQPIFLDSKVCFTNIKQIGSDKSHLKMDVTSGLSVINSIGFGIGELYQKCQRERPIRFLYSPSLNHFRGKRSWQARIVEIKFAKD
jgi:single-stranded-DNA-specific exonuclease